ncbi:TaqI-like C-terminal specificity domain-containing protein [Enterococcus sp. BWB1-3]|uniref:TaqI-like C-terminal specificity domain-containing protein n=1 Tax=Enterococcus sp. BWB1-3 TaxID=2787713 RepID=UPI001F3A385A|nr:TaqI-like C-terminal specificity domain-containing protein [Enterococcus sp. BWB1-3]
MGKTWTILSEIEESIKDKVEEVGTPLKEWDISINYGIKTGLNEAFIISDETRKNILDNCVTKTELRETHKIIQPIIRGKDIKRYIIEFQNLFLINVHNGYTTKENNLIKPICIDDYPAIKSYLSKFDDQLSKRTDKGVTHYNLRSLAYMDDFFKQKLIYPNMTKYLPFVFDENGYVTNQKCFIITGENIAYLTAFFNSSLFKFAFSSNFPELQGGTRELSKIFFEMIPVKKVTKEVNQIFYEKITKIQNFKKDNIYDHNQLEVEVDNMIFDIYGIKEDQRKIIGYIEI